MTAPVSSELIAAIERLKIEGNGFYSKRDFEAARQKYSEAIEKDPKNPVLYANRAAAYLGEKQYMDAAWDCQKSVDLDPTYAKAWGRLGTSAQGMENWEYCATAYQKALDCLPSDESILTDAQKTMKAQFSEGLAKAEAGKKRPKNPYVVVDREMASKGLPWIRAKYVIATQRPSKKSSAYVIDSAADDYKAGLDLIKAMKVQNGMFMGKPDAMTGLVNGIIADERAFFLDDPDLPNKLTNQCRFENMALKGWAESGGPAVLKKEAVERLKEKGWDATRQGITVTVRIWIFQAYFRSELANHREVAHDLYNNALGVLQWGREIWADVPKEDRGAVFERSFIRGVKRLKMLNMHKSLAGPSSEKCSFSAEDLVKVAEDLIHDTKTDPCSDALWEQFPGTASAFYIYPEASAYSILGWYHLRNGSNRLAAEYYEKAGSTYPVDDENRGYFLRMAVDCLCNDNAPLKEILPLCQRIRVAIPKSLEIWQVSTVASVARGMLKDIQDFEFKQMRDLSEGKATMSTVAKLPPVLRPQLDTNGKPFVNVNDIS
ncbi:hypothetical protein BKA70DRAFT_1250302 [Coprinopsis sp. MPI-PUGE-AT-0042]|nr:hypothetical protein BKA70DRAFT_1250302 [Coprinopsis sp. MPI-PUGE-AT-0042]